MTLKDFMNKYGLDPREAGQILEVFDKLYLEFTSDQAFAMLKDYLEHADELFDELDTLPR